MVDPHLADDESVILATENIRVRSVSYQALILTNKRVLLIRTEGEKILAEEFLLTDLRSALVSQAARDDSTLLLSYITPRGDARRETIVFPTTSEKRRTDEVREWAKKLSDQLQPLPDEESPLTAPAASRPATPAAAGTKKGSSTEDILAKHGRLSGLSFPDITISNEPETPSPSSRNRIVIAALVLVVLAVLAGVFLLPHPPSQEAIIPPSLTPVVTPVPTEIMFTAAPPVAVPSATPAPVQLIVPSSGVWIRVQYSGNYTGSVGSSSNLKAVSDTGDHLYQQAITTGSVRAIVEKEDSSSQKLTVDIYKDGKVVEGGHGETTRPFGEVNLQIELAAITTTPAP